MMCRQEIKFDIKIEDEEENPVVDEIPLYINQSLPDHLVVYKNPLHHGGLSIENSNVVRCCIRENSHGVMFDLERDIESSNYCTGKGEQMAINVDGRDISTKNPEDVTFPNSVMDRQTLVSKTLQNTMSGVGVLHNNELHITPVSAVMLLRPSFKHIDKSDKQIKTDTKDGTEGEASEEEEEAKQITVKFARQETERSKKARQRSFGYINKMSTQETWIPCNFYEKTSHITEVAMSLLYCNNMSDTSSCQNVNLAKLLLKLSKEEETSGVISAPHGMTLLALKSLPLLEKVKALLIRVKVLTLKQLTTYLGCTSSESQDYLRAIQQVAVLVQGCWVVQSDVLYSKDSPAGCTPIGLLKSARDYILYLFTKHKSVSRKKIADQLKLSPDLVKDILLDVALLVPATREWQFKLPQDNEFLKLYPEVVQRQTIKWEMKHEQLVESFNSADSNVAPAPTARYRRKSHRDSSFSSDNEGSADTRRNSYQVHAGPHKMRRAKKTSVSLSDPPNESS